MGTEAENIHRRAAGRLAEDRNIVRIAVEALDIRAYPFQGKGLIPETLVTTADVVSRRPEAQIPHPVLDSHHYHVFLTLKLPIFRLWTERLPPVPTVSKKDVPIIGKYSDLPD